MFLLSVCLLIGYPCQDQIRTGLFDTREECAANMPKLQARIEKRYKDKAGKLVVICREMSIRGMLPP